MLDEENFGFSLGFSDTENKTLLQSLYKEAAGDRRDTFISLGELVAIPYAAERLYQILPEPWNNTIYSGMVLLELVIAGVFLHSGYDWWKNSKRASELEKRINS